MTRAKGDSEATWRAKNKALQAQYRDRNRENPAFKARHIAETDAWRDRNEAARLAHYRLRYEVRMGRIQRPTACEKCGTQGLVHASHDDYSRPLDVEWLCPTCHKTKDFPMESSDEICK